MTSKRSDIIFSIVAILIDVAMIVLAFAAAYWLRIETESIRQVIAIESFDRYLSFILTMVPFWVIIFALAGLYSSRPARARWGEFTKVFLAVSAAIMFFVVWVFLSRTLFFSRLIVLYAWPIGIFFVFIGRLFLGQIQRWLFTYGLGVRSVVIIGQSVTAETLKRELESDQELGYNVINGLLKPDLEALKSFLKNHSVDEIIVADSDLPTHLMLDLIALAEEYGIRFRLVPNLLDVKSTNVEVETLAAVPILAFRQTPLGGWASIIKRIFDVILSGLALFLLSPIYVLIGLLVKLDSPGPVYYRHKRLGYNKKPFYLYKFRSMKLEYCVGDSFQRKSDEEVFVKELKSKKLAQQFKKDQKLRSDQDPRVTRVGRFLRKTSLDELPQFFNVFLGQLSLVGPRPIIEDELERYGQYRHRLFIVKPGVTGLWQVSGRSDMPYADRVKLDMYYIENWSLWTDFVILVKTFFVVLFRKNAY